jgi:putative PIN family toxin of toxin-antitoxin system
VEQALETPSEAPVVVLDTNVALGWLAFADPRVVPLAEAIMTGKLRWLASAYMRQEFDLVLRRPALARYAFDGEAALAGFDRHSQPVSEAAPTPLLRCRDSADQPFIDLALAHRARWLYTHDRDLLALARRALRSGLEIRRP